MSATIIKTADECALEKLEIIKAKRTIIKGKPMCYYKHIPLRTPPAARTIDIKDGNKLKNAKRYFELGLKME